VRKKHIALLFQMAESKNAFNKLISKAFLKNLRFYYPPKTFGVSIHLYLYPEKGQFGSIIAPRNTYEKI